MYLQKCLNKRLLCVCYCVLLCVCACVCLCYCGFAQLGVVLFIHPMLVRDKNHTSKSEIRIFFKSSANISIVFENTQVLKTSTEAELTMLSQKNHCKWKKDYSERFYHHSHSTWFLKRQKKKRAKCTEHWVNMIIAYAIIKRYKTPQPGNKHSIQGHGDSLERWTTCWAVKRLSTNFKKQTFYKICSLAIM